MSSILKQYESLVFIVKLNLFSTNFYCFQLFLLNSTLSNHLFFTNNHHHILSTPSIHFLILPFPSHHISHNHPLLSLSIPLFCFISISSHLGSLTPTHLHKDSFLHYRIMTKKRILEKEKIMKKNLHFCFIQSHNSYSPHTSMITKALEITARFSRFVFLFFSFHIFIKKRHIPMAFIDPSNKFFDNDDYAYNSIAKARIN